MAGLGDPFLSPALGDALAQWLAHLRALEGAAVNTIEAYRRDVTRYLKFLSAHRGGAEGIASVAATTHPDLRAWMAYERSRNLSPRSLSRALSAVKSFTAWAADRTGADATTVLSARGPKHRRKLPRPLSEDAAATMLDEIGADAHEDWIAARDAAIATLLYGLGLRISEALSLTGADHPLPETLRITGKGGKTRPVPVIPAAAEAVAAYVALCPFDLLPADALFRGARGGPVNPRLIQRSMERARFALACPPPPHPMRSATASPPTSLPPVGICGRFKSFWAMPRSRPPRPIPPSMPPV